MSGRVPSVSLATFPAGDRLLIAIDPLQPNQLKARLTVSAHDSDHFVLLPPLFFRSVMTPRSPLFLEPASLQYVLVAFVSPLTNT